MKRAHRPVIAPSLAYTLAPLRCMDCGRDVTLKYRKDQWPLAWWYARLPQKGA